MVFLYIKLPTLERCYKLHAYFGQRSHRNHQHLTDITVDYVAGNSIYHFINYVSPRWEQSPAALNPQTGPCLHLYGGSTHAAYFTRLEAMRWMEDFCRRLGVTNAVYALHFHEFGRFDYHLLLTNIDDQGRPLVVKKKSRRGFRASVQLAAYRTTTELNDRRLDEGRLTVGIRDEKGQGPTIFPRRRHPAVSNSLQVLIHPTPAQSAGEPIATASAITPTKAPVPVTPPHPAAEVALKNPEEITVGLGGTPGTLESMAVQSMAVPIETPTAAPEKAPVHLHRHGEPDLGSDAEQKKKREQARSDEEEKEQEKKREQVRDRETADLARNFHEVSQSQRIADDKKEESRKPALDAAKPPALPVNPPRPPALARPPLHRETHDDEHEKQEKARLAKKKKEQEETLKQETAQRARQSNEDHLSRQNAQEFAEEKKKEEQVQVRRDREAAQQAPELLEDHLSPQKAQQFAEKKAPEKLPAARLPQINWEQLTAQLHRHAEDHTDPDDLRFEIPGGLGGLTKTSYLPYELCDYAADHGLVKTNSAAREFVEAAQVYLTQPPSFFQRKDPSRRPSPEGPER